MSSRILDFRQGQRVSERRSVAGYTTKRTYTLHRIKTKYDRNDRDNQKENLKTELIEHTINKVMMFPF
jgi:hypothetical protein